VWISSTVLILPVAMNRTFAGEQPLVEVTIAVVGILLVLAVLLRFGLLSTCVMFYTFLLIASLPLTFDFSRPYAAIAMAILLAVGGLSVAGFVASRGGEPLFGRALLKV
jgi:hypothetical protein